MSRYLLNFNFSNQTPPKLTLAVAGGGFEEGGKDLGSEQQKKKN
jgi:hypothetical protein